MRMEPIAIVGMGAVLPESRDLDEFWSHVEQRRDLSREASSDRWLGGGRRYVAEGRRVDTIPHCRGYFVDHTPDDWPDYQLPPEILTSLDPSCHLALKAARQAWQDSRGPSLPPTRAGVILGNLALPTAYSSAYVETILGRLFEQAQWGQPLTKERVAISARNLNAASLPALIIGQALGLQGLCYSLDAACASSLYALKYACDELNSGRADYMLAGGLCCPDGLFTQMGFHQLQALSPQGCSRPFDQAADGLLVGEGSAMFALKRLTDARTAGDHIHGVITGIGLSNDMDGRLMAPSGAGQLQAMRAAYEQAGWQPAEVDYIECHATGTPVGDQVELKSLLDLWGDTGKGRPQPCRLSSLKGTIGHLLTASGAAGLVRVLLCLKHQQLPGTTNFADLPESLNAAWAEGPFAITGNMTPWDAPQGPRRAALSAFGFGGTNAHLLIEEAPAKGNIQSIPQVAAASSIDSGLGQPTDQGMPLAIVGVGGLSGRQHAWSEPGAPRSAAPQGSDQRRAWYGLEPSENIAGWPDLWDLSIWAWQDLALPMGRFRIPPHEFQDMLPQQVAMLLAAMQAADEAGWSAADARPDTGIFVGLDVDALANTYRYRWKLEQLIDEGPVRGQRLVADDAATSGGEQLKDSFHKPLTANRVLGSLASLVASRLAREFRCGGMGVTVSGQESSGLLALERAAHELRTGNLQEALVGAVDHGTQLAAVLAACGWPDHEDDPRTRLAGREDMALALILKTKAAAEADGDTILGLIHETEWQQAPAEPLPSTDKAMGRIDQGAATGLCQLLDHLRAASHDRLASAAPNKVQSVLPTGDAQTLKVSFEPVAAAVWAGRSKPSPISRKIPYQMPGIAFQKVDKTASRDRSPAQPAEPKRPGAMAKSAASTRETAAGLPFLDQLASAATATMVAMQRAQQAHQSWQQQAQQDAEALLSWGSAMARGGVASTAEATSDGRAVDSPTALPMVAWAAFSRAQTLATDDQLTPADGPEPGVETGAQPEPEHEPVFDFAACREFAEGQIQNVFGAEFAEVDHYPSRVRLPMEHLLLCHRVMELSGEARSLGPGRLVTEHDVTAGSWYLDNGCIPAAIAIEAGQADLLLSAWLGADFVTKGLAYYRLLDAAVTFSGRLPQVGDVIRYVIEIERFFKQGPTLFFRFSFTAYVGDEPLMTMRNGCAGFFSPQALEAGRGIVQPGFQREPKGQGRYVGGYQPRFQFSAESYSGAQLDALRAGRLAACFGDEFAGLSNSGGWLTIPDGAMRLVHRIRRLDATGGWHGLGYVVGEADIQPDDWFLTCHFKDDHVMPGTLMYECCLHTLRVFLLRMGWLGAADKVTAEPVIGVASELKCRGQVLPHTRQVSYELHIREMGYGPEPYVIADALMYADEQCIVDIHNMTLRLAGLSQAEVEALWQAAEQRQPAWPPVSAAESGATSPVFDQDQLLEFATGRPSRALGPAYAAFDDTRKLARLPRPPLQMISEVVTTDQPATQMSAGGTVEARYLIPEGIWYFAAEPGQFMPYSLLLEVGLQACGWLAAYMGSALRSEQDLFFRNLQGKGQLHRRIQSTDRELVTRVHCTKVAESAGMILQSYGLTISTAEELVYTAETSFGFFTASALDQQRGLPGHEVPAWPTDSASDWQEVADGRAEPMRMVDELQVVGTRAGEFGQGRFIGRHHVDPGAWYFTAHFLGDPVMPGSLGLEGLIQTARHGWRLMQGGTAPGLQYLPVASEQEWVYRGQVRPDADQVRYDVHIREVDFQRGVLTFDGYLWVDDLPIYKVKRFSLSLASDAGQDG
jgi:3-oxoacyl-(acyl-carrier-protein) synthase/3-hydroxymyristoyl/3-hydroxydecanoyl-(acyl carrier protein) dehydratase